MITASRFRHFTAVDEGVQSELFDVPPQWIGAGDPASVIGASLGAVLYVPADRPALARDLLRAHSRGAQAVVIDLEDSVSPADRGSALENLVAALSALARSEESGPAVFVRTPTPDVLIEIARRLQESAGTIWGFAFPKLAAGGLGAEFFSALEVAETLVGHALLAMPILESEQIAHRETRLDELIAIRELCDAHRDRIAVVRIGATDISGRFGLRRSSEFTVYDIRVTADALADIVNVFGRESPWPYPISGPVWEHFAKLDRTLKPRLRESPFTEHDAPALRGALLDRGLDGLISEVELDKINGMVGKTVIHPSHVNVVHSLSAVTHEEHGDALAITANGRRGGVVRSAYGNKMNEVFPHSGWADRVLRRSRAFGVLRPGKTFVDLMLALERGNE